MRFEQDLDRDFAAYYQRGGPVSDADAVVIAVDGSRGLEARHLRGAAEHLLHLLWNILLTEQRDGQVDLARLTFDGQLASGYQLAVTVR